MSANMASLLPDEPILGSNVLFLIIFIQKIQAAVQDRTRNIAGFDRVMQPLAAYQALLVLNPLLPPEDNRVTALPLLPVANNATAAAVYNDKLTREAHAIETVMLTFITTEILRLMGSELRGKIVNALGNHAGLQAYNLLDSLRALTVNVPIDDIHETQGLLKYLPGDNLATTKTRFTIAFLALSQVNVCTDEANRYLLVRELTQGRLAMQDALIHYERTNREFVGRTWLALFRDLMDQLGESFIPLPDHVMLAAIAPAPQAAAAHKPTAGRKQKQKPQQNNRPYCFFHGYRGHVGTVCTYMSEPANNYTLEMKEALSPCIIAGVQGSK